MNFVVTRYNITGCWFGKKPPRTQVDALVLKTILSGFDVWVDTSIRMADTLVSGTAPFRVFVRDSESQGSDFAVSLWLSATDGDDNVYAINGDDPPNGEQRVEVLRSEDGGIPGTPAFFFVDTGNKALYTMRPDNIRISGKPQFDAAMRFYMEHHAQRIHRNISVDEEGVFVESLNMIGPDGEYLKPKFESELQRNPTRAEEILRRCNDIRKLIRVQDLSKKPVAERQQAVMNLLALFNAGVSEEDASESRRIKCEVDVRMSREEVEDIIRRQAECGSDEKIAFKFKGDSKPMWADECIARRKINLDVGTDAPQRLKASDLLHAIEACRRDVVL